MFIRAKATSGTKAAKAKASTQANKFNAPPKTTGTSPAPPTKK